MEYMISEFWIIWKQAGNSKNINKEFLFDSFSLLNSIVFRAKLVTREADRKVGYSWSS